ncbi:hypothetical protein JVT61DRAFT_6318 [Boletus reticuloceps]|uniref:MnmG N-terminal domain-containing protein n=1 Tax=Boletus reticuloceps TaxID=495285 RepID=A0A8I3A848_9AGAM|nr:hypothetical protein JVT61DRAFT_6318 [Boletus reticuloceps]
MTSRYRYCAGMKRFPAGRFNEVQAFGLSASLRAAGFPLGRLQTGTLARLDKNKKATIRHIHSHF